MSVTAKLDQTSVRLDAGGQAVIPLQIRNNGEIVEGYRLAVVGVPAAWATLDPETVSLYPGDTTTATVTLRPPRSASVPAGEMQFGVRVEPTEHPDDAVVPEGVVEVLPYLETTAELSPRTTRGRRGARHRIAIDNRGNTPVVVALTGQPGGDGLAVATRAASLVVEPGHAVFTDVRARPVRTLWRGDPVTHPFAVLVSPESSTPVSLDGTHVQDAVVPAWWLKGLLALLAIIALLAALWFGVFKPTIASAAKEAVAEPVSQSQAAAEQAAEQAEQAGAQAEQAGAAAQSAQGAANEADAAAGTATAATGQQRTNVLTVPLSDRLQARTAAGGQQVQRFTVGAGQTLDLTDFVLQNPQGDFGRVTIALGSRTLFSLALENFRDIDYHFVSPIKAVEGDALTMQVECRTVGVPPNAPPPPTCDTALFFGGELTRPAP
jgi:hypothetical protein